MSLTKKRKSDVHCDQVVVNPKKEKWYDEEQKMKLFSAPLEPTQPTSRRSSFMGALKRMVSGSSMKDKTRSKMPAAQLPSGPSNSKENSFASEASHESENQLPVDKLVNNYGLRRFVQTGEAPTEKADMSIETSYSNDPFDTTISSSSVLSTVTPVRDFRRETSRRTSCRSMPETSSLVNGLALTGVRRHSSSVSAEQSVASPVSRPSRLSFRIFKTRHSTSMADLPENGELNMSFAPLAEADEDINPITPELKKENNLIRTASRLFGSGKKRTTIATPNEIFGVSTNTEGKEDNFSTPTGTSASSATSPTSSGIKKRMTNAFNMLVKASPPSQRKKRVQRSKTENPKKDHGIRKRTEANNRRSTCHNMSFMESYKEQELQKEKAEADRFRKLVRIASEPVPTILEKINFDAVLVDIIGGKPASAPAGAVLEHYSLAGNVQAASFKASQNDERHFLVKEGSSPVLVCVKMDEHASKPLEARVRNGVGNGLGVAWTQKDVSRILAYPMCFNETEWNDTEKCIEQFFTMVLNALDWDKVNENLEYVMLAGVSPQHMQLMKERFDLYLSKLPNSEDLKKDEIIEADI